MTFRYDEIGDRLKAFRRGSGLSADEVAAKLGISRTALYRFEKGELAKIESIERLAELLNVSIPTLLGVGIEYISSAVSYYERKRQIEETSEHIVQLSGPISLLLASDDFVTTLPDVLTENITKNMPNRARALADVPRIMEVLHERRESYRRRRPTIVSIISAQEIGRFLHNGFVGRTTLSEDVLLKRKVLARAEVEHLAHMIDEQPIGIQVGIVIDTLPHTGYQIFRQPHRRVLIISPFRLGEQPNVRLGVAMITSAPEALALHESAVKDLWGSALKGSAAATYLKTLLAKEGQSAESAEAVQPENRRAKRSSRKPSPQLM